MVLSKKINKMSYYIQVTFDTEGIKKNHTNASQDSENPTEIEASFCYMVASSNLLTGTSSFQLDLVKDGMSKKVRFYGASASNNFEDSVIIYSIFRISGVHHLTDYTPVYLKNTSVTPGFESTLPPNFVEDTSFYFLESKAWGQGEKEHEISFVLYDRDELGKPSFYGYFKYSAVFNLHEEE